MIRRSGVTLLILGLLSAFGPLSTDLYLPGLPELTDDFGASASAGQLTLTTCVIGIALGQLFTGPISDAHGRRGPLLIGLAAFIAASVACAFAPNIAVLVALRFVQGLAGGAGIVIATAIVRDLYSGAAAARAFSLVILASGLAPIIGPTIGAQLLRFAPWQSAFVFLAGVGALLLVASALGIGETLPRARRHTGGLATTLRTFRRLLADGSFMPYAATYCLAFGAVFAYIAGSPFVLENVYGLSPQAFGLVFGAGAVGFMVVAQVSGFLVHRVGPLVLLTAGAVAVGVAGTWVVVAVATHGSLALLLPGLLGLFSANGLIVPNAQALALANQSEAAGSASALLGLGQFGLGALVAPLVGLAGAGSAIPMGVTIAVCSIAALVVHLVFGLTSARRLDVCIESQA